MQPLDIKYEILRVDYLSIYKQWNILRCNLCFRSNSSFLRRNISEKSSNVYWHDCDINAQLYSDFSGYQKISRVLTCFVTLLYCHRFIYSVRGLDSIHSLKVRVDL